MYPSDFATADAAYVPVDQPLFLGLPPLLALLALLCAVAIAVGAYVLGRRHAEQGGGTEADRAAEEIHKAILIASMAAMAASSDELKARAQSLRTAVANCLGPVLELARGVAGPVKALDEALKGEVKVAPDPASSSAPKEKHGTAGKQGCDCGKPDACACGASSAPAAMTINQVYVGGVPVVPQPACGCSGTHEAGCGHPSAKPGKPGGPDAPKTETRAMSVPEQVEALSKAVRQFHDHWSRGPERIRELRDARAALSRRPPPSALKHQDQRVWERH